VYPPFCLQVVQVFFVSILIFISMKEIIKEVLKKYIEEKEFKKPRKMSKSYCKSTPCNKMGFSQKASCRPYKNCYK